MRRHRASRGTPAQQTLPCRAGDGAQRGPRRALCPQVRDDLGATSQETRTTALEVREVAGDPLEIAERSHRGGRRRRSRRGRRRASRRWWCGRVFDQRDVLPERGAGRSPSSRAGGAAGLPSAALRHATSVALVRNLGCIPGRRCPPACSALTCTNAVRCSGRKTYSQVGKAGACGPRRALGLGNYPRGRARAPWCGGYAAVFSDGSGRLGLARQGTVRSVEKRGFRPWSSCSCPTSAEGSVRALVGLPRNRARRGPQASWRGVA